ncbi:MAG: polysaccharide deacetylase family protein [Rhodoferax sp.]
MPYRSLYVAPIDFQRQMALLHRLGFQGLSMSALGPYLSGERCGKVFGITFDDGYLNNLTNALPVLQRYGFSSTCYVVSQQLGRTNIWDREVGIPEVDLMTADQLQLWIAGGQEVGAHTRHHVRLPMQDAAVCRDEIAACKSELETLTGTAVGHFCYPYGAFTPEHEAMVRDAGYLTATTTQRSRCLSGESFTALPRVPVLRSTTRLLLWFKMVSAYEDRRRS